MKTFQVVSYPVIIEEVLNEGGYIAYVPSLPGCHTQGETIEEAEKNIQEALGLYLESIKKRENFFPPSLKVYQSIVNVKLPA